MKWIESRSENLISTGFARDYHMRGELALKSDGTMLGLRASLLADEGAFYADAQPSKFKAGLFHIVSGSYDLPATHVSAEGAYTNKAPGGVAYRCSFRVTEASYLIERLVLERRVRAGDGPRRHPEEELHREGPVPVHVLDRVRLRLAATTTGAMDKALEMIGYDDLRKEQDEARAQGKLYGIGVASFTEVVGAGSGEGLRHHRREDERRRRAPDPPDRQGDPEAQLPDAGAGARDDVRADRRRASSGSSPRTSR